VRDQEIDRILEQGAAAQQAVDSALLDRISHTIGAGLIPSRPLPANWVLISGLILACTAIAVAGGVFLGPRGIQKMDGTEIGLIFSVLAMLFWLAAGVCVSEHIPGSRRRLSSGVLVPAACVVLLAVFGAVFRDYHTTRFVAAGMKCLIAGLVLAIPASAAVWWLLNRGAAMNPRTAGLAKGVLAGLAGIMMLEIHCANFEALHVLVWHVAVLPASGLLASLLAWKLTRD
jgi:hypothetical protein